MASVDWLVDAVRFGIEAVRAAGVGSGVALKVFWCAGFDKEENGLEASFEKACGVVASFFGSVGLFADSVKDENAD